MKVYIMKTGWLGEDECIIGVYDSPGLAQMKLNQFAPKVISQWEYDENGMSATHSLSGHWFDIEEQEVETALQMTEEEFLMHLWRGATISSTTEGSTIFGPNSYIHNIVMRLTPQSADIKVPWQLIEKYYRENKTLKKGAFWGEYVISDKGLRKIGKPTKKEMRSLVEPC